jgi:hypothetical protein
MMDDLRNHDTEPTREERAWMAADPLALVAKLVVLAILAVAIGLSATQMAAPTASETLVASQH